MTLFLLLLYSAGLIGLGLWIGRGVRTTGAFFVAGRELGPGLLFATILAANIGAGSTVGAASRAWRDGFSAWWWVGSAGLGTILLGLWLGPLLWRTARDRDLHTVGDFLELRYGAPVRGVVSALLWVGTLAILGSQLMAIAWVLDVVADIPRLWGCILGGLVVTAYFYAGGLVTSAWVNLVQLVVLVAGFGLALPFALDAAGGQAALLDLHPTADYWEFTRGGASGWVYAPLLIPAFLVSPGLLQKCWGARSARAVRLGVVTAGAALLVFSLLPTLLGMTARLLHPVLDHPDLALPTLLVSDLPPWLGVLGLAAVFSAELSSADAILFMLATSLSRDLYQRFLRPEASDADVLKVARRAAAAGGAFGVVLAVVLPDVIAGLQIFYALLGVSLLVLVVVGVHGGLRDHANRNGPDRRRATGSALSSVVLGVATLLWARGADLAPLTPNLVALLASALAFALPWVLLRRSEA